MSCLAQALPEALQFGALGLCAVMVVLNWRDRQAMATLLEQRNQRYEEMAARYEVLSREISTSMRLLADALSDRPCLHEDSRVNHHSKR